VIRRTRALLTSTIGASLLFWSLSLAAGVLAILAYWIANLEWAAFGVIVIAGLVLGVLQARVEPVRNYIGSQDLATLPSAETTTEQLRDVWLAEYQQIRSTRNLASESAAKLFQYFQVGVAVSLVLAFADPRGSVFGLGTINSSLRSALLAIMGVILATIAADVLHWQHDVMTLEDYTERYLRPLLSRTVGFKVLRMEEYVAGVRSYGDWRLAHLLDLTRTSWIDPFVLKEAGHVAILGLSGVVAVAYAYHVGRGSVPLMIFAAIAAVYAVSVWASYVKVSAEYLRWKRTTLRRAWGWEASSRQK
jgi:hypothetical protein